MARSLTLISAPAETPITLAEAKAQIRLESSVTADDDLLTAIIEAATESVQAATGLQLVTATWELALDSFADVGTLPKVPLAAITSIKYDDEDDVEQTVSTDVYGSQTPRYLPGSVYLKDGQSWPSDVLGDPGAVRVRYTAGYGAASDVPSDLKCAVKMMVGHLYENREAVVIGTIATELPLGVANLLSHRSVAGVPS